MCKYCFFDPFTLSWRYALVQVSGNVLLFSSLCGDVVLFETSTHSPPSWHIASGLVVVTGVCAHLLLIRLIGLQPFTTTINNNNNNNVGTSEATSVYTCTQNANIITHKADNNNNNNSTNNSTNNNNCSNMSNAVRYDDNTRRSDITLTRHMPLLATLVSVMMGAVVYIITFVLSSSSSHFMLSDDVTIGLRQVQQLLATLMFVLPPFTHMQGHFLFGSLYEIWSPFNGTA